MRRGVLSVLCAVGVFSAFGTEGAGDGVGLGVPVAQAEERADGCIGFRKNEVDKGLVFDVESSCEQKLACRISWQVECADNDGNVTRRDRGASKFALDAGASHSVPVSAEICKQSWKIEDVTWACDPTK